MEKKIMILLINKNRLRNFKFGIQSYKGVKIGDLAIISHEQAELLGLINTVVWVEGFYGHSVVLWSTDSPRGGKFKSTSFFKDLHFPYTV